LAGEEGRSAFRVDGVVQSLLAAKELGVLEAGGVRGVTKLAGIRGND